MPDVTQNPEALLAQIDLFSGLSGREMKKLVRATKEVDHPAGHEVASEGRGAFGFHLILSGDATVTKNAEVIRELHPGDYFGEISMIDGKPRSATVTAGDGLKTLVLTHYAFQELIEEEPAFARGLLTLLCARLRAAEEA